MKLKENDLILKVGVNNMLSVEDFVSSGTIQKG